MARSRAARRESTSGNGSPDPPREPQRRTRGRVDPGENLVSQGSRQEAMDRKLIRSKYNALMNMISEKRDDLAKVDSVKFNYVMNEVEKLHELVQKPREQVTDAEALLDLANTLVGSVKSLLNEGITPSDFVNCLLIEFGQPLLGNEENDQNSVKWKELGLAASPIFMKVHGCCTMLGPMNAELKQRKTGVQRTRTRPTLHARPEELDTAEEKKTDTDKNMSTMFEILRRKKRVRLENLILNRKSFAQTVENLFALSFLVKDGRVDMTVDEKGCHYVSPRNAPSANSVMTGEVVHCHFMFRYDYKDWKLMLDVVPGGEELMPHRVQCCPFAPSSQPVANANNSQPVLPTTPIRKLTRNRGRVLQEDSVAEESPLNDAENAKGAVIRRSKRKLTEM